MTSKIVVNNIESDSGISSVTFTSDIELGTKNLKGHNLESTGIVTAVSFTGSGANLTNLPAGNLSGTLPALDGSALTGVGIGTDGNVNTSGIVTATAFVPTSQGGLSHRNILMNGACAVSQRGTSFSGAGFTLDRYYVGSGDYSVAQVTDAPSNSGLTYSLRVSRTASTTGYLTFQMIELPATGQAGQFYNGAKFTLSGYVKGTSGATIVPTLRFSTATNGSNGNTFTRTEGVFTCNGSWQPFTFHFTVDENVGGSDKCVQFYFTFVTTATGQNVFFTGLQLEAGEVATPFEHRSHGDELRRCQRYYYQFEIFPNQVVNFLSAYGSTWGKVQYSFPVTMRANPTGGLLDISGVQEYLSGSWNNRTLTIAGTRKDFVQIFNQRSDSGFGGQYVRASSGTPICTLNAEL